MNVQRMDVVTPVIVVDDFLPKEKAAEVLEETLYLQRMFNPATVLDQKLGSVLNEKVRRNETVYLDSIFGPTGGKSKIIKNLLKEGLWSEPAMKVWSEGNTGFEMINRCTRSENVLSRYGEGDFYDFHRDYNHTKQNRLITVVYYFHVEPAKFSGGNLLIKSNRGNGSVHAIEPINNRLVVFNSGAYHSVEATHTEDDKFESGRFSLNTWLGFNQ